MPFVDTSNLETSNERMILQWWRDKFIDLAKNCMLSINNVHAITSMDTRIRQKRGCIEVFGSFKGRNNLQYDFSISCNSVEDDFKFYYTYYTKGGQRKYASCSLMNFRRIMDWFFFSLN